MEKPSLDQMIIELKQLIVTSCDKDVAVDEIADDEPLFGSETRLALDSLDALQLSMAIQKRYGVRLVDSKETRRVMSSVQNLAQFLAR